MKLAVVDGKTITQTVDLRGGNAGPTKVRAIKGGKFILASEQTGHAPENITIKRVGKHLHLSLEGDDLGQPALIIEDYYGNEGQLVGMGEDGAYHEYISSDADENREAAFLADGANAPLVLGAQQVGGLDGLVAAEGVNLAGLGWFALAGLGLLGGALAASLIGGGKDDGGNGGGGDDGGGGRPPAQPTIDSIYDNVGDKQGEIGRGETTDDRRPVFTGRGETPGNKIEIYDNGKKIGETVVKDDGTWTFQPDRPLADGPHDFTAVEVGKDGQPSVPSDNYDLIVDPTAPDRPVITAVIDNEGNVTGPISSGGTTDDRTPEIRGTAQPGSLVKVYANGELIGSAMADANGDWTLVPGTPLADGTYAFTATATSPSGSVGLPSDPWTVIVDTSGGGVGPEKPAKPTIDDIWDNTNGDDDPATWTPIADGDTTKDKTPVIGGSNGTPGNTIIVIIDDKEVGTAIVGDDGKWLFPTPDDLADGEHKYEVIERDPSGNESDKSDPVKVIVDSPVKPVITEVVDNVGNDQGPINPGDTTDDPQPVINGTAKAGSHIEIYDGDTLIGTTTADENGNWTFQPETPLANGHHYLTAVATDPLHGAQTSDRFDFAIDIFRNGLMYGWEDLDGLRDYGNSPWQLGEERETKLFNITANAETAYGMQWVHIQHIAGGSPILFVNGSSRTETVTLDFDMKGKQANMLSFDGRYYFGSDEKITFNFYDIDGKFITSFDLDKDSPTGLQSFEMPDGQSYATFSIVSPVNCGLEIFSMLVSDREISVEDLNGLRDYGNSQWQLGEERETELFNITASADTANGMQWVAVHNIAGGSPVLAVSASSRTETVTLDFDMKGKQASTLSLDLSYYADVGQKITFNFYDLNGKYITSYDIDRDSPTGMKSFEMPNGESYAKFSIVVPQSSSIQIYTLSPSTPIEWPQQPEGTDAVGTDHDFSALDGLGGDVFYVNEGDEDAISFTGTDGLDLLKLTGEGQVLDLSNLQGKLASIEAIDLTGTGANTLKL
ncbi:hypothetical protein WK68_21365, partial [Burkholderia ubonensis]